MRILYFHQYFSTPKGSTGIRSYEMARHLVSQGHHVTMVCGSYDGSYTGLTSAYVKGKRRGFVEGIEVIEFELPYSNTHGFLKRTSTFVKFAIRSVIVVFAEKYDLVFATSTPLTAGVPGIFARWFKRKKFVFEVRDLWPELPREMGVIKNPIVLSLMSILESVSYRSASRIIGLSPGIVKGVASRGIEEGKITMIPNGCDMDLFSHVENPVRPEGVLAEDLLAIYSGTHGKANGLDAVLDAAVELKRRNCADVKLVFVGDGKEKASLMERAAANDLDNVVFIGRLEKSELANLFAASDLGIQSLANIPAFYYGTSPNKFFDYISSGLPVILNYPGWLEEIVSDHECGVSVAPDNPKAFADALEWAAANRGKLRRMGEKSKEVAQTMFNRRLLAQKFEEWLVAATK